MSAENNREAAGAGGPGPEKFEEILGRLRGLVDRLEGGNLPLEESLRAFEEGMELCRRGTAILDDAERKVETLLGSNRTAPFDPGSTSPGTSSPGTNSNDR